MSLARDVRYHLKNKPYIQESLEKGIVNLSALARQIQTELKVENFEAVKASLRRLSIELQKQKYKREERVLQILKKSSLTVYDGDTITITDTPLQVDAKVSVTLKDNFVYLFEKGAKVPKTLKKHEDCTTILIHSPPEIETVPGVVAYLTSLLSVEDVNILEFVSCWTDTIIVVSRKDALRSYEVLSGVVG